MPALASDEELAALAAVVKEATAEAERWAGMFAPGNLPEHVESTLSGAASALASHAATLSALERRLRGAE